MLIYENCPKAIDKPKPYTQIKSMTMIIFEKFEITWEKHANVSAHWYIGRISALFEKLKMNYKTGRKWEEIIEYDEIKMSDAQSMQTREK